MDDGAFRLRFHCGQLGTVRFAAPATSPRCAPPRARALTAGHARAGEAVAA